MKRICLRLVLAALGISAANAPALARKAESLTVTNVQMIDGTGKDLGRGTISIRDGRIKSVSRRSLRSDRTIDGSGLYAVPGFIDAHLHLMAGPTPASGNCADAVEQIGPTLSGLQARGFTTIMSLGDPLADIAKLRDKVDAGQLVGPRLMIVGPTLVAVGHPSVGRSGYCTTVKEVENAEQARAVVEELARSGVDGVKIIYDELWAPRLDDATVSAIVVAAHQRGLPVFAHVETERDAVRAVELGVDRFAHLPIEKLSDTTIAQFATKRLPIATTIHLHALLKGENGALVDHGLRAIGPDRLPARQARLAAMRTNVDGLVEMGGVIAFGTDRYRSSDTHEDPVAHELESLPTALSGSDRLRMMTLDAARFVGREKELGRLAKGMQADIVLLGGDPRRDPSQLGNVVVVIEGGEVVVDRRD